MIPEKTQILVVDDFATMRKYIIKNLTELGGTEFLEAEDGDKAWDILNSQDIDFVVCDWNMPNMTGIELLRLVRSDPALEDLPFLIITAETDKNLIIEAAQAGASQFIVKPFTLEILKNKLEDIYGDVS